MYGRRLGLAAVVLDTAKGFVPAFVATKLESHGIGVLAGGAAMFGHYRPLFLRFRKGGKMVATAGGAFLGVAPIVGGIAAGVWLVVFGGEALRPSSLRPWFARFGPDGPRLVNMYGITETTVHVTYRPLVAEDFDAESTRLIGLGARKVQDVESGSARWTTFADVEGNEFDLL